MKHLKPYDGCKHIDLLNYYLFIINIFLDGGKLQWVMLPGERPHNFNQVLHFQSTVEPLYKEVLGTMKIALLYQVSRYIRVKKQRNIKSWDQQNDLVIRGFCYIRPLYNEVPLYRPIWFQYIASSAIRGGLPGA